MSSASKGAMSTKVNKQNKTKTNEDFTPVTGKRSPPPHQDKNYII